MDGATVVSLLGVLGLGSIAGQYIAGGGQRRETRADVLRALGQVETARWEGPDEHDVPFRQAMRDLDTTALLARLPRNAVVHYKALAQAAYWLSAASWDEHPDPEYGGGINGDFADVVRDAATDVSQVVWRPWASRVGLSKRIRTREDRAQSINDPQVQRELKRSSEHLPT